MYEHSDGFFRYPCANCGIMRESICIMNASLCSGFLQDFTSDGFPYSAFSKETGSITIFPAIALKTVLPIME